MRYLGHHQCGKCLSIFDSKMIFLPASSFLAEALTMDLQMKHVTFGYTNHHDNDYNEQNNDQFWVLSNKI